MARGFYVGRGGAWQMRPNESEGAKSVIRYTIYEGYLFSPY